MKKCLAFFLALSVCFCLPAGAKEQSEEKVYFPGDVNGNGVVEAADALVVLRYCVDKATLSQGALIAAETDLNEEINGEDALHILQAIVGKPFDQKDGRVNTSFPAGDIYSHSFFWWDTVEDNMSSVPQVWLCQTYEDYQAFLALGYVQEDQRQVSLQGEKVPLTYDSAFFETYGLVLWYRMSYDDTGGLDWKGAFTKDQTVYMDLKPYSTDGVGEQNAQDSIYSFYFKKSHENYNGVAIRFCSTGMLYSIYSYSYYAF